MYNRGLLPNAALAMSLAPDALAALTAPVLARYGRSARSLSPLSGGLINLTLALDSDAGEALVLQRLHPSFEAAVNDNFDIVTGELRGRGELAPRLLRTLDGARSVSAADGLWRLQTRIDGHSQDQLGSPAEAHAAGELLGRFHATLADWTTPLPYRRPAVHEPARHLTALGAAIEAHPAHRHQVAVRALALEIATSLSALPPWPAAPLRLVHGDPKISNLLFDDRGRGLCLVDLDTLAHGPLVPELGDAFRSWCNPGPEDAAEATFALPLFAAALEGYATHARAFITAEEQAAMVDGVLAIYLELAARFAADALNEAYFGWSPVRFASRGDHNLARARNQLAAARDLARQRAAAGALVAGQFSRAALAG